MIPRAAKVIFREPSAHQRSHRSNSPTGGDEVDLGIIPDAPEGAAIGVRIEMEDGESFSFDAIASGTSVVYIVGPIVADGHKAATALMRAGASLAAER